MKIQIYKDIHEKLKTLAQAHNIAITDLANVLLSKMLGNHHKELEEIIEKVKNKNAR